MNVIPIFHIIFYNVYRWTMCTGLNRRVTWILTKKFTLIVRESPRAIRSLTVADEIIRLSCATFFTMPLYIRRVKRCAIWRYDFFRKLDLRSSWYSARNPITGFAACFCQLGFPTFYVSSHSPLFSDRHVFYLHRMSGCNYLTQRVRRPFLADEKCTRASGCAA